MSAPILRLEMPHCVFEAWPDSVRTIFPDGKEVTGAPNGEDTLTDCACHELAHSIVADIAWDSPSVCLRGVADGHGRTWTHPKLAEEERALRVGSVLAQLVRGLAGVQP